MQKSKLHLVVTCIVAMFILLPVNEVSAKQFTVTPGVEYKEGVNKWNNKAQSIHTVEVDVTRPEILVEAIIPSTLNTRTPLTTLLERASSDGRHVVAGINASFFDMSSGAPAYLLATDNIVNTYGVISSGNDEYMSVPSAFGIDKNGKGQIGKFGYESSVTTPSGSQKINSINKERGTGEIVLYTPTYSYGSTRSNNVGMEIVLTNLSGSIEENYRLGTPITAKVDKVLPYGGRDSVIPRDGAVLSIQGGDLAARFADVKVGSEVSLSVDLTDPWKEADFVLASGPLLVQNGKVDMTINPKSSRATSRAPRTAVAVNADGSKVFFVTVDGRSTNSVGMTLSEFSSYLVSLGAHAALNLDGGGSTTMAVRDRGKQYPQLFNSPSDKYQRPISAVLGAVSYTTVGQARTIEANLSGPSVLLEGGTTSVQVESALDVNFHVVPVNLKEMIYAVTGDVGTVSSTGVFTATNVGKGSVEVSYGDATKSFPIEVLSAPSEIKITGGANVVGPGETIKYTAKAFDGSGRELAFSPSIVTWSASAELGSIDASGVLTTNESGKGNVTVKIGTKSVSIPVEILKESLFTDVANTYWAANEISFAVESGWINGYPNGTFKPEQNLTRAHAAVLLSRALKLTGSTATPFTDVPTKHPYAKEIGLIYSAGIMGGKGDGKTFDPDGSLTRAQMAKVLAQAYTLTKGDEKIPTLKDVPSGFWAVDDIQKLQANGITVVSDGYYRPNESVKRSQFAVFMTRADKE